MDRNLNRGVVLVTEARRRLRSTVPDPKNWPVCSVLTAGRRDVRHRRHLPDRRRLRKVM
jgi:hypothetical protein